MRDAETVLNIIRDRGKRGLPLEDVYRRLYNPDLFVMAYGKIARNKGAMTPGITTETADGMSLDKIQAIITLLRQEKYRWTPVRRIYIEKKHSTKKRPLGIPTWSDKLLQEVIRLILEAYYEPQFSDHAHSFRPNRGPHTALTEVYHVWKGTTWFIEGDITACFDSLDHSILLSILRERIHDNRFIRLIENLVTAGYLEEWKYFPTTSGTPQGGVVSPILSNIYLDKLDRYIETVIIPHYTRGDHREPNPAYYRIQYRRNQAKRVGNTDAARKLHQELRKLPVRNPTDPEYRRLRYVRYADDFLLGLAGPHAEAEDIKRAIGTFLRESLRLELSDHKTLITHARTEAARFLGYELTVLTVDTRLTRDRRHPDGVRAANGKVGLKMPLHIVKEHGTRYLRNGKPSHLVSRTNDSVYSIIMAYELERRGLAEYYRMAYNLHELGTLRWVMETSLVKTLAHKLRLHVSQVYRRYRAVYEGRKVLQVTVQREGKPALVATWNGTSLERNVEAAIPHHVKPVPGSFGRTELEKRFLKDACTLCGATAALEVHHIRALKDLKQAGRRAKPIWVQLMATRQRKTLVVCRSCHTSMTHGYPRKREHTTNHRRAGCI